MGTSTSLDDLETELKTLLNTFYTKHVLLPYEQEKFHFSLIIGATKGLDRRLWTSERTTLRRSSASAAVGAGAEHALHLLSRFYRPMAPVDENELLAAYVAYSAKEIIDACGKYTDIISIHGHEYTIIPRSTTQHLERQFEQYALFETAALHYILGRPVRDAAKSREDLFRFLDGLRAEIEDVESLDLEIVTAPIIDWDKDV